MPWFAIYLPCAFHSSALRLPCACSVYSCCCYGLPLICNALCHVRPCVYHTCAAFSCFLQWFANDLPCICHFADPCVAMRLLFFSRGCQGLPLICHARAIPLPCAFSLKNSFAMVCHGFAMALPFLCPACCHVFALFLTCFCH